MVFHLSFDHNLRTRGATKQSETFMKNCISHHLQWCHFFTSATSLWHITAQYPQLPSWYMPFENALLNHLQTTLLKSQYCKQCKLFHYDLLTVNLNIYRFLFLEHEPRMQSIIICQWKQWILTCQKTRNGGTTHKREITHVSSCYFHGNMLSCIVKPHIEYNIVSLCLPHFLHSLHLRWAL